VEYFLPIALAASIVFLFLRPSGKVWIAFFIMTNCFDLAPATVLKTDVWDVGVILLLMAWIQLKLSSRIPENYSDLPVRIIRALLVWMVVCFTWSVVVLGYPLLTTIKASRQMILGYFSFFVLLRLFAADEKALNSFLKLFYVIIYALLIVCIIQYMTKVRLLFGLVTEYEQATRGIPIFMPLAHLFMWNFLSRILSGEKTSLHQHVFVVLTLLVTLITFTRGIYFALFLSSLLMLGILFLQGRLATVRVAACLFVCLFGLLMILPTTLFDRVAGRLSSSLALVNSAVSSESGGKKAVFPERAREGVNNDDTLSVRIDQAKERFQMVAERNPIFGFGFIHEKWAHEKLKLRLKYGLGVIPIYDGKNSYSPKIVRMFHSVDIGWPNFAIDTGFVGFTLFIAILGSIALHYFRYSSRTEGAVYSLRLAFFVQIFMLVILMFNGNPYIRFVQIPAFIIAGYMVSSRTGARMEQLS